MLVSGDVYDRAMPSPETVELLSQSLLRLVDAGRPGRRQQRQPRLRHPARVRVGPARAGRAAPAHLRRRRRAARCWSATSPCTRCPTSSRPWPPTPWAPPSAPTPACCAPRWRRVRADAEQRGGRTVVMAHAFVTGGVTSESERDITRRRRVGGAARRSSPASTTPRWATCTAARRSRRGVRYSGSPVAMSFSEWAPPQGQPARRPLRRHPGGRARRGARSSGRWPCCAAPSTQLLADPAHAAAEAAWCQVTLTDPQRPLGAMDQVRRRFPLTLELRFDPQGATVPLRPYAARVATATDVEVCCDFLGHVRGGRGASDDERALLAEAVEASRVARQVGDDEGVAAGPPTAGRRAPREGAPARDRGVRAVRRTGSSSTSTRSRPRGSSSSTGPPARARPACSTPSASPCTPTCPARAPSGGLRSDHAGPDAVPRVTLELTAGTRRLRITRSPEFLRPKKRGTGTVVGAGHGHPRGAPRRPVGRR